MKTFTGAEVAPINELLERTLYVKALRDEIYRMGADLRWHEKWIQEHQERIERLLAENAELRRQLTEETELHNAEWRRAQALGNEVERLRNESARISTRLASFETGYRKLSDAHLDLASKLTAAHAELHDLRIKLGLA